MKTTIKKCTFQEGSIQHYKHYSAEWDRIKLLAEDAKGQEAEELYYELDGITMILEEYVP